MLAIVTGSFVTATISVVKLTVSASIQMDIGSVMKATSACGLGMAAPNVTESLVRYFPEAVAAHADNS